MCSGQGCVMRKGCYRFTATPSEFRQSYFVTPPVQNGTCDYLIPSVPSESPLLHNEETGNKNADPGTVWVCGACGKRSSDLYGNRPIDPGWDESCMLNAVLCYDDGPPWEAVEAVHRVVGKNDEF